MATEGRDILAGGDSDGAGGPDHIYGGAGDDTLHGHSVADEGPDPGRITAQLIASGFSQSLFATSAPGDPDRLFVVEKGGVIRLLDLNIGATAATPFLQLPSGSLSTSGERGLLGLAFHPDYAANGRFYVYLTGTDGDIELREFTRASANAADPASGRLLLRIEHSQFDNHNGGWLGFGPDGFLYMATGDGGGGGDRWVAGRTPRSCSASCCGWT